LWNYPFVLNNASQVVNVKTHSSNINPFGFFLLRVQLLPCIACLPQSSNWVKPCSVIRSKLRHGQKGGEHRYSYCFFKRGIFYACWTVSIWKYTRTGTCRLCINNVCVSLNLASMLVSLIFACTCRHRQLIIWDIFCFKLLQVDFRMFE